jgi:hypothetical protein
MIKKSNKSTDKDNRLTRSIYYYSRSVEYIYYPIYPVCGSKQVQVLVLGKVPNHQAHD